MNCSKRTTAWLPLVNPEVPRYYFQGKNISTLPVHCGWKDLAFVCIDEGLNPDKQKEITGTEREVQEVIKKRLKPRYSYIFER